MTGYELAGADLSVTVLSQPKIYIHGFNPARVFGPWPDTHGKAAELKAAVVRLPILPFVRLSEQNLRIDLFTFIEQHDRDDR